METLILFLILTAEGLPVKPILQVDDSRPFLGDHFLSYPYDALFKQGKLYLAEEGHPVLVFGRDGFVQSIGSLGEAGDEFRHQPVTLDLFEGKLLITERYGRSRSLFTLEGTFVNKEALDQRLHYLPDGARFQKLHFEEAFKRRFVLKEIDTGRLLGKLKDDTGIGFHLSNAWPVRLDANHLLIVKARGAFEVYDRQGVLIKERTVPLELYKKEVERDPLGDAILKHRPRKIKYYRFGLPLFDVAVESPEHIWFLVGDEESQTEDDRKPMLVTLYRMSLKTGHVSFKKQMPAPLHRINIDDGAHLVLLSQEEAMIQVYSLAQIRTALGE